MFRNLFNRKLQDLNALFNGHYVDVKVLYALTHDKIPVVSFIGELDITKSFAYINNEYKRSIVSVYQHSYFDHAEQKMLFNNTIFILTNFRMIEVASNYCQLLHTNMQYGWANDLVKELSVFRQVAEPVKENRVIGFARQTEMAQN